MIKKVVTLMTVLLFSYFQVLPEVSQLLTASPLPVAAIGEAATGGVDSLPSYVIGSIPAQPVFRNATLNFQLLSPRDGAATFAYSVDQKHFIPSGSISLNSSSGVFSYTPATTDRLDFWLTFSSKVSGQAADVQSVHFTLPPESDLIQSPTNAPDPASTDYLLVTQSQNASLEVFNGASRTTWNPEISGKTVVIDSSSPNYGGLYARFNNRPDIKNMSIYAETLIVRAPLKLPGTNLTLYVRHLVFEDTAGTASIDTTPISYLAQAANFTDGLPGQNGGNITLHIQDVSAPGAQKRFITHGGNGQDAGQGQAGNDGTSINGYIALAYRPDLPWTNVWATWDLPNANGNTFPWMTDHPGPVIKASTPQACVSLINTDLINGTRRDWSTPLPQAIYSEVWNGSLGTKIWPGDGQNAKAGGKPGNAGSGGSIISTSAQIASLVDQSGGQSGAQAAPKSGGAAGKPIRSVWITATFNSHVNGWWWYCVTDDHTSSPGQNWVPSQADTPVGATGNLTILPNTDISWLHPALLRPVISYANDTYKMGNLTLAKAIFQDYENLLNSYSIFPENFSVDFEQMQNRIETVLHRLANNMDFYGNSAGFAPFLTLESTMSLFKGEVDVAVPVILLSRYLQTKSDQNVKDVTVLNDAIAKARAEATAAAQDMSAALESVPDLNKKANDLTADLENFQAAVQQREAFLIAQAEKNIEDQKNVPDWKKSLRIIGTVAELVPVYQPALGAIGQGLNFITTIDPDNPLDSLQHIPPDVSKLFSGAAWKESATSFKDFTEALPHTFESIHDAKDTMEVLSTMKDNYARNKNDVNQAIQSLKATQISDADVQNELAKIEAQDTALHDLISRVASIQTEKQAFADLLAKTQQRISSNSATISEDLASIASMYQNLNSTAGQFDHAVVGYVKDMENRARERLGFYQYYMAKAYEYRMLKPYPGNLNVDSVVNQIQNVIATDGYQVTSAHLDLIKSVYLDSVRQIVFSALNELNQQPPERSLPFYFNLPASYIQQLNQTGHVTLNLAPFISGLPNEDNRHIADLAISSVAVDTTASLGPVARIRFVENLRGNSTESLAGHYFDFHVGGDPKNTTFTYGQGYTLPNGPLSQETYSIAGLSLLQSFLNVPSQAPVDAAALNLFVRPGADAIIDIDMVKDPANLPVPLTNVQMEVTVDFFRTKLNLAKLSIDTGDDSSPYFTLDHPDVTGRSDGRGSIIRTFPLGSQVTVIADPFYGGKSFANWVDETGKVVGGSTTLTQTLAKSITIQPIYAAPLSIGTVSSLVSGKKGAAYSQIIAASGGTLPYRWSIDSPPSGLVLNTVSDSCSTPLCPQPTSTAILGGSPSVIGTSSFTVQVTDATGVSKSKQFQLTIVPADASVAPNAPSITGLTPGVGMIGKQVSVKFSGKNLVLPMVIFAGNDISISNLSLLTSEIGTAVLNIAPNAKVGPHVVTVETSAGKSYAANFNVVMPSGQSDFNGDGNPDLLLRNIANGQTSYWRMSGSSPVNSTLLLSDPSWSVAASVDFDGDGISDLLWSNAGSGQYVVWLMNGDGPASSALLSADPDLKFVATGDFNGDGKSDLLWYNAVSGQTSAWLMNGSSTIDRAVLLTAPDWKVTAIGDLNGDGKSDLLWYNAASGQTAAWLMNGTNTSAWALLLTAPDWKITATGDLNGDGKSDLLWYNAALGQTAAWLMNGTSTTDWAVLLTAPDWKITATGDLNGDGKSDLLWYNASIHQTAAWLMNGNNAASWAILPADSGWKITATGDLNGDGKSDLLWQNETTGQSSSWLMNGMQVTSKVSLFTDPNLQILTTGK